MACVGAKKGNGGAYAGAFSTESAPFQRSLPKYADKQARASRFVGPDGA
jgi:hypothetical protein